MIQAVVRIVFQPQGDHAIARSVHLLVAFCTPAEKLHVRARCKTLKMLYVNSIRLRVPGIAEVIRRYVSYRVCILPRSGSKVPNVMGPRGGQSKYQMGRGCQVVQRIGAHFSAGGYRVVKDDFLSYFLFLTYCCSMALVLTILTMIDSSGYSRAVPREKGTRCFPFRKGRGNT